MNNRFNLIHSTYGKGATGWMWSAWTSRRRRAHAVVALAANWATGMQLANAGVTTVDVTAAAVDVTVIRLLNNRPASLLPFLGRTCWAFYFWNNSKNWNQMEMMIVWNEFSYLIGIDEVVAGWNTVGVEERHEMRTSSVVSIRQWRPVEILLIGDARQSDDQKCASQFHLNHWKNRISINVLSFKKEKIISKYPFTFLLLVDLRRGEVQLGYLC